MIKRYLDICTSHLRKETLDGLQPDKWPYSYSYKEGVFITCVMTTNNFYGCSSGRSSNPDKIRMES